MSHPKFPDCVCGAWYEWSPLVVEGKYRVVFEDAYCCNMCGRPACHLHCDGGNAFIVVRRQVEIFPPEVRNYIFQTRAFFADNQRRLLFLREQYAESRYMEICIEHGITSGTLLCNVPQQVRLDVAVEVGAVFIQDEYDRPHPSVNPCPLPSLTSHARVCVLAPGTPPKLDPLRQYWYVLRQPTH